MEDPMRVLLVEDDRQVAEVVRRGLERSGYAVDVTASGVESLWYATEFPYDVMVLDLNLPNIDGLEVCRRLRASESSTPMLMLTSRDDTAARVTGLDCGADDYVPKPFQLSEVLARVRALTRRGPVERPVVYEVGDTTLDLARRVVTRQGRTVDLTAKEFAVLAELMRTPDTVVSGADLVERAWDFAYEPSSNVVAVYIGYLRNKLDRPFGRASIVTVRGHGYRYDPAG
jgi:two-component system, OmpR family, response regulator